MRRLIPVILVLLAACRIERAASGRPAGVPSDADSLAAVEQDSILDAEVRVALRTYYERFSARDWRGFRRSFWPGATITTRVTPPGERRERVWVTTAEDFARRGPDGPGRMAVFNERMLHVHITGYGDLASAWVMYEGRWGSRRDSVATVRGIDTFHLYRDGGEWRISGLTFTREVPGRPLVPPRRASGGTTPAGGAAKSAP